MTLHFLVSSEKSQALQRKMQELGIQERDLEEQFVRSSGAGGQKVNKTSSCVLLRHAPSGIQIKCQKTRNQSLNRFLARRLLCKKIEEKIFHLKSSEEQKREKIRRQKRRRTRRGKEQILKAKHHRAEIKKLRKTDFEE